MHKNAEEPSKMGRPEAPQKGSFFGHLWPPINVLFCLCARRFLKNVDFRVLTEMLTFHFFDTKKL